MQDTRRHINILMFVIVLRNKALTLSGRTFGVQIRSVYSPLISVPTKNWRTACVSNDSCLYIPLYDVIRHAFVV